MPVAGLQPQQVDEQVAAGGESRDDEAARSFAAAVAQGLRYLSAREHTCRELVSKLAAKGYPRSLAERAVAKLQDQGQQSDERFAEVYVHSRLGKGYGPVKLRLELGQRGVPEDLIDAAVTFSADRWLEVAEAARRKRFGSKLPDGRDAWNTQARFLARRGFPADLIYGVLGHQ